MDRRAVGCVVAALSVAAGCGGGSGSPAARGDEPVTEPPTTLPSGPCDVEGATYGFDGGTLECVAEGGVLTWREVTGGPQAPELPSAVTCGSPSNPENPLALESDNDNARATLDAFPVECVQPRVACEPDDEQSQYQWYRTDLSLSIDPKEPTRVLVGIERMGMFQSRDRGTTWAPLSEDGVLHSLAKADDTVCWPEVTRLTFDGRVPGRIFLHHGGGGTVASGTWQARGAGLYRSDDDGATWNLLTTKDMCAYVAGIAISATDPETIYLGTTALPYDTPSGPAVCVTKGLLYRSTDGGATWTELPTGWVAGAGASIVWVDPTDDDTVMIGVTRRPVETTAELLGTDVAQGWYRSTDGGLTWAPTGTGEGWTATVSPQAAVSPDGQVIVNTADDMWVSVDGGATWTKADKPRVAPAFDPHGDGRRVYAVLAAEYLDPRGVQDEFTVSDDGGLTWTTLGLLPPEIRTNFFNDPPLHRRAAPSKIVVDPTDPMIIYVAGAGGLVARSDDGGATWQLLTTWESFTPSAATIR